MATATAWIILKILCCSWIEGVTPLLYLPGLIGVDSRFQSLKCDIAIPWLLYD